MIGGLPGRVLALQHTIGNRAVRRLLRETDPRLTYTKEAEAEGTGLDATPLPFTTAGNPDAGWDGNEILGKLTQVDESNDTFTDPVRCGANSVLAVAINRGARDTIAWARAIMRTGYASPATHGLGDKVWESIARLEKTTATYGDLSNIAHHAKVLLSKDPRGKTTGYEVAAMIGLLGGMQSSSTPMQDEDMFRSYFRDLKAREAFVMLVDTSVLAPTTRTRNLDQTNHYVVVGKDAAGKAFLYDPYPRVGTQLIRSGDQSFWTLFKNAQGQWKSVYLFARPSFK
ncbi:MAG: hypothetical protein ABWZ67_12205 [Solirubrobacteraceae bacterium]